MQTTNHFDLESVHLPLQSNNQEANAYEVYDGSIEKGLVSTKVANDDDSSCEIPTRDVETNHTYSFIATVADAKMVPTTVLVLH